MPSGTRLISESLSDNHSERSFAVHGLYLVKFSVTKYASVAEVDQKYNEIRQKHSDTYSIEDINIGDKGFKHPVAIFSYFITFYKSNIGVTVIGDYYDIENLVNKVHI